MTFEEATKIAKIIQTADNGCSYCVQDLCDKFNIEFSQFRFFRDLEYDGVGENVIVDLRYL